MKNLTKEQAVKLYESEFWKNLSSEEIVKFQLFEDRLCMPFSVFHEAVEKEIKRPVFTHEFAYPDNIRKEFLGEKEPPTLEDIINLMPKEKRIIVVA